MNHLTEQSTVAEWVTERPGRTRLFERLGIDYCCGGQRTLAEACSDKGLDAKSVVQTIAALESLEGGTGGTEKDWRQASLTELAIHIEETHHRYVKEEAPRLEKLAQKVAAVHGANHPELFDVKRVYGELQAELLSHLQKEEGILFPAIKKLEAAGGTPVQFGFGTVANPIHMMISEHDSAGHNMEELRRLTNGYQCPPDGCGSFRGLYDGLKQFEEDLHEHIHKENNILFPRAIELERAAAR